MANWAAYKQQEIALPVHKRARHSIHFMRPDGLIQAEFTGAPCHYLDGAEWKPIDTKLQAKSGGWYGCPHSDVIVHPDGRVAVEGTDYSQYTALPGTPTGKLDGDRIVRKFTGGRQYLYVTESGFRQEIVLDKIPSLTVANAQKLLATVSGSLPLKYIASQLTAMDADGKTYTYDSLTNLRAWMTAAKYPVMIDPDFSDGTADGHVYGTNADYATARATSSDISVANVTLLVGQTAAFMVLRGFLLFDTSSIGSGSNVTQVNLKLTSGGDTSVTDFDIQIVKQDWSAQNPLAAGNREAAYDNCLSGTADDSIMRSTSSGWVANTQYTSGNLSTSWVSKTGTTYYSLRSSRDLAGTQPTGNEYVAVDSANHGTSEYRPVLTVLYSSPRRRALLGVGL